MIDFKQNEREPEGITGLLLQRELITCHMPVGMMTASWGQMEKRGGRVCGVLGAEWYLCLSEGYLGPHPRGAVSNLSGPPPRGGPVPGHYPKGSNHLLWALVRTLSCQPHRGTP